MSSSRGKFGIVSGVFLVVAVSGRGSTAAEVAPTVQKPVGAYQYNASSEQQMAFVSPDFAHALVNVVQGTRTYIAFDGQPGPALTSLVEPTGLGGENPEDTYTVPDFSPDGSHVAYSVMMADYKPQLYIDTQPAPVNGPMTFLHWSPTGDRLVCVYESNRERAFFDGKTSTQYEEVSAIRFSKDGKHLAYIAEPDGAHSKKEVVTDGKPGELYTRVAELHVSEDGSRVIYSATDETGQSMLVDNGMAGTPFRKVENVVLSANGQRSAYKANVNEGWLVVDNGKPGNPYGAADVGGLAVSDDGQTLAYAVRVQTGVVVVVNGTEYGPFESTSKGVIFGPGGKWAIPVVTLDRKRQILMNGAPLAMTSDFQPFGVQFAGNTLILRGNDPSTAAAGEDVVPPGGPDVSTASVVVSPDGTHAAKVLSKKLDDGETGFVVAVDDQPPGPIYLEVHNLCMSDDGKHVAFVAKVGDPSTGHFAMRVVHDGVEQPSYDNIQSLRLSPDGKHVAYVINTPGAQDSSKVVVIDGATSPSYTWMLQSFMSPNDQLLKFSDDGTLRFAAVSNGQLNLCAYTPDAIAKMPAAPPQAAVAAPKPEQTPAMKPSDTTPPPAPQPPPEAAPVAAAPTPPPAPAENVNPPAGPGVGEVSRITTTEYTYLYVSQQTNAATFGAAGAGMTGQLIQALQAGKFTLAGPFIWTFHNASADPTVQYTLDVGVMVPSGTTPPSGMTVTKIDPRPALTVTVTGASNLVPTALQKLGTKLMSGNLQKKDVMRFIITHFEAPESPKNVTEIQLDLAQ